MKKYFKNEEAHEKVFLALMSLLSIYKQASYKRQGSNNHFQIVELGFDK